MYTAFLYKILNIFQEKIIPLTAHSVSLGNKIFGAAIIKKEDLSVVVAGTNNEIQNPLWHGEIHTLKIFYEMPEEKRPNTKDCLFISSHEPCSLCLSAITFSGFNNFYYLFNLTCLCKYKILSRLLLPKRKIFHRISNRCIHKMRDLFH